MRISRRSPSAVPSTAPHSRSISSKAASWSASVLMGFSCILNRPHVDCVVLLVRSQPFDKDRGSLIIHGNHQPVGVSFDIEDNPVRPDNAGMGIAGLHVGGIPPLCLTRLLKPGVECGLQGAVILASLQLVEKPSQRASGNNAHTDTVSCSQYGYKPVFYAVCPISFCALCEGWETKNPVRANAERLPHRRCLQIISLLRRTMIPEVFLPIIVPARPLRAVCQPEAAGRGQNVT